MKGIAPTMTIRHTSVTTTLTLLLVSSLSVSAFAQTRRAPEHLIEDPIENGFFLALDVKFSTVEGEFANFTGLYGGWLINHRFLIGVGGYGRTNDVDRMTMGYGGGVFEYFFNPGRLVNYSIRGLVGAGHATFNNSGLDGNFFAAEPEVRVQLNLSKRLRLGFGTGYRFTEGAGTLSSGLGGFTAAINLKLGSF